MLVLGISAFYHDSAVCLVDQGNIIFSAHEERYTRKKHDPSFPTNAIRASFEFLGTRVPDYIVFYEKPLQKFHRIFENILYSWPRGFSHFQIAMKEWFSNGKINHTKLIRKNLKVAFGDKFSRVPVKYSGHHLSHAASAYYCSPFFGLQEDSLVYVADAVGEWDTASLFIGSGTKLTKIESLSYPHSIGMFYSAFTAFLGFKVNSGEYKLMGLAPYGKPVYADLILERFFEDSEDGLKFNLKHFGYLNSLNMFNDSFAQMFKTLPRKPDEPIRGIHCDIASSVQNVLNIKTLKYLQRATEKYGLNKLCMAGGVSLNCSTNSFVGEHLKELRMFAQPASGDAGGAAGAALAFGYASKWSNISRDGNQHFNPYLGSEYTTGELRLALESLNVKYSELDNFDMRKIATSLEKGEIIGLYTGRSEFGPRALGNRSILASPIGKNQQRKINSKIKFREGFRPFAPVVLEDDARNHFKINDNLTYDHMLFTAPVNDSVVSTWAANEDDLNVILDSIISPLPAITHVDGSARVQVLRNGINPLLERILREFRKQTGIGVLVNTSFNVRGEPPVETPMDAFKTFLASGLDYLICQDIVISRHDNGIPVKNYIVDAEDD